MSQASDNLTKVEASVVWQQLSDHIDRFVDAWQDATEPPELAQFLPAGPPELRRLALVEAIKVDLEYRWQERRWPKRIDAYLAEFPELAGEAGVPCDLIYEEYHIRKQRGDDVSLAEYAERFPTRAEELERLFKLESPEQTTVMVSSDRVPAFEPGQRIDDFDLLSRLGKGAFASVYLARQVSMQRMVALKVSRDKGFEPQTLAQLEHPNIVRVYDQRQLATRKLRLLYMQYVPGGTLQGIVEFAAKIPPAKRTGATLIEAIDQALTRAGEQPPGDSMTRHRLRNATWPEAVCWLGARLAGALAHAHAHGVLHRDMKPANILIGPDAQPKLADFNISFSKLDGATPAAYFGGTLAYMSPEQLEACDPSHDRLPDELDGRSDMYSLGVVLWELLSGRRPFANDGLPKSWSLALPRLASARRARVSAEARAAMPRDCPPRVVETLLNCLEPEPADRYAGAAEFARELELCLQPRAHALLHTRRRSWRSFAKYHPVSTTLGVGLLPNLVLCVLNVAYNWQEIVGRLSPEDQRVFYFHVLVVNLVSYAIGLGYVCVSRWSTFVALARLVSGQKVEPPPSNLMLRRSLRLGLATAVVTAALWTISGFIFPAWMQYGAGDASRLSAGDYTHFIVSNLLCGMISATQSYYVVTFLSARYCCPWLLRAREADTDDVRELAEVVRRGRVFLVLTFSVPFLALVALSALTLINFDRSVIGALGGIGLAGCALAYLLDLSIRGDVAALAATTNAAGDSFLAGDSLDSFLTGSRR